MDLGRFRPADVIDAMPDWIVARAGKQTTGLHPVAMRMIEEQASLKDCAKVAGRVIALQKNIPGSEDDRKVFALGMSSSDFSSALSNSLRRLVWMAYDAASPHNAFTLPVPVRNFMQVDFPAVDLTDDLPVVGELSEIKNHVVNVSDGLSARLYTYGGGLIISRNIIINDDIKLLDTVFTQRGAAAARTEARVIYDMLESNPVLADSESMFHIAHGNIVSASLDATSLAAAMGALRKQPTLSGNMANNKAAFLIVSADIEYVALKLLHDISATTIEIIASPWLPAARWYLAASPLIAPVIGRLYLEGNHGARPTIVEALKPKIKMDGVLIRAMSDFGSVPLSRIGIVRGGA